MYQVRDVMNKRYTDRIDILEVLMLDHTSMTVTRMVELVSLIKKLIIIKPIKQK